MIVCCIVWGEEVWMRAGPGTSIAAVRERVLVETANLGRPADEFQVRSENGQELHPEATLDSANIRPGDQLWVTPAIGSGGIDPR